MNEADVVDVYLTLNKLVQRVERKRRLKALRAPQILLEREDELIVKALEEAHILHGIPRHSPEG